MASMTSHLDKVIAECEQTALLSSWETRVFLLADVLPILQAVRERERSEAIRVRLRVESGQFVAALGRAQQRLTRAPIGWWARPVTWIAALRARLRALVHRMLRRS